VEFNPFLYQKDLHKFCQEKGIQLEAYSPLSHGKKLSDPILTGTAKKYKKSPAQILIRWALQHDVVAIPKSRDPKRIAENASVFDFSISKQDMKLIDNFHENFRTCWDPTDLP
jgi:diketogulonate reductase-like aldo/keto reductase